MQPSQSNYDWLGGGIYFWESDPRRAWEWAVEQRDNRKKNIDPFVIGAVIDLGDCLDLMARQSINLLQVAYQDLIRQIKTGETDSLPENNLGDDKILRERDCFVINHLHGMLNDTDVCDILDKNGINHPKAGYDSVRGLFTEGNEIYKGASFKLKTHIQIAVRNINNIKGIFRVDESEYATV